MSLSNDTLHNLNSIARGLAYADAAVDFSPRVLPSESVTDIAAREDVQTYVARAFPELCQLDFRSVLMAYALGRNVAVNWPV